MNKEILHRKYRHPALHIQSSVLKPLCCFSSVPIFCTAPITPLLFLSPCSASRPSEPSDELHVVHLLQGLLAEPALRGFAPMAGDGAVAHHLRHCPYHDRLLKTLLNSGQELQESLHGQPLQTPLTHFLLLPLTPSSPL